MSNEKWFPSDLILIKNVNYRRVEEAGRSAVEQHNRRSGNSFIYKSVVNGLTDMINDHPGPRFYIIVIEALNDDGIHWSYIAKVLHFWFHHRGPFLFWFEDAFKDFNKH